MHARLVIASALGTLALTAPNAAAHAVVSPPVAQSGALQYFTLSVPTEKEGATTTKVELDVPPGFAIDSYQPAPGWKRESAKRKVVWSGGRTPTEEDSVFGFNADASKAKDYTFTVHQTYSDGSVVDWNGPESSDTPAPVVQSVASLGGGDGGGGSSALEVIALIVAGLALVLAVAGLATRSGRRALT